MPSRKWDDLDRQVQRALAGIQSQTEKQIVRAYSQALKSIRNEMSRLYEKVNTPDGKLTLAEMTKYHRLNSLDKRITQIMKESNGIVIRELKRLAPEMYGESFFHYAWAFDQNTGVALNWGTVSEESLRGIIKNPLDLIARDTLPLTTRNRIRSAIAQGLLQGKSYPQMARQIRDAMGVNAHRAMRIARTEGQRAQNEGIYDSYNQAKANGVQGGDVWDATKDGRTRDTHRAQDGAVRGEDGRFPALGGVRPLYPVDPALPADEAINCRCRLRFQVDGYAPVLMRTREQGIIPYQTYGDWADESNYVPTPAEFAATLRKAGFTARINSP